MSVSQEIPQLGSYRISKELGRDAFGNCYQAFPKGKDRPVWIRALSPEITSTDNFVVRFELLRSLLPSLEHKHLRRILELGISDNIYFIVKEWLGERGEPSRHLGQFKAQETPSHHQTLEVIFDGVAQGLSALEAHKDSFFKTGLHHENLSPDQVWIVMERSLIGPGHTPVAKVDGFAEPFLFYGDSPEAKLKYRFAPSLWEQQQTIEAPKGHLYDSEYLYAPATRQGKNQGSCELLYSFGSLVYWVIRGLIPKGKYPSLLDFDPSLNPLWEEIVDGCLSVPQGSGFSEMTQVTALLRQILNQGSQLNSEERRLKEADIPQGMALVVFHDKVELGAKDGPPVERPSFRARIHPFFMDLYPVTVEQFSEFLPSYQPSSLSKGPQCPATQVTWHMAKAFCDWRSAREGLPKGTYRLPSEYEWEAACRGSHGDLYAWGNEMDCRRLHCNQETNRGAVSVHSFPPTRFGLHDLLGNTWEWTESMFKPHPFSRHWEAGYDAGLKVAKGGCWLTPKDSCRATLRAAFAPNDRRPNIGFRCVRLVEMEDLRPGQDDA